MKQLLLVWIISAMITTNAVSQNLGGAWQRVDGDRRIVIIFSEKYFSAATYSGTAFVGTYGGSYQIDESGKLLMTHEFNTLETASVGKQIAMTLEGNGRKVTINDQVFESVDGGESPLAGAWLITGRMQGESMSSITPGARRTMKILSGTRFQWIAYNVETKEFLGTGGGTFTAGNGTYKETIEFFSRDQSRVGKSLEFSFAIEQENWRHKGLSSRGEPIDEIWTKREKLGL